VLTNRTIAILCFTSALLLVGAITIVLLIGFTEWLQTGRWHTDSLLQAAYDARLLRARWFLSGDWAWQLHEILDQIPVLVVWLVVAPLFWAVGLKFARR
jgi:hypothetical protein